ncbi:MAG TPA: DUF2807 domain-containing protein [Sphingomicrobium sp.]|nr:DUF2807 domain-containing protein [Sphingomicrobium sp.]
MSRAATLLVLAALAATPSLAAEVVAFPPFDTVQLRGGGEITVRPGPVHRVELLEGSRQFTDFRMERGGKLTIDACNRQCPRNYRLRIDIQSPRMPDVAISGGGSIVAAPGFAPQSDISAAIHGGGVIDLRSVAARDMSAAINGGGKISAGRISSLSAAVNGGGDVRYSGNPQVRMAVNGGGNVSRY